MNNEIMGFLQRIFGQQPRYGKDFILEQMVAMYRQIAELRGCAPGPEMTDTEIIQIYKTVEAAFQEVARAQGKPLPPGILYTIVHFFLQKYQMIGKANPEFFAKHIAYEVDKFKREGLRDEYNRELTWIFEDPLWYKQIPEDLKFPGVVLKSRMDMLRQEVGFNDDHFFMAVMHSKQMTCRSVRFAYNTAKSTIPNLKESEYLALTIGNFVNQKLAALPCNTSPTAWTADQLLKLLDQVEVFVKDCKDINGILRLVMQIEDQEGNFNDPLGIISRIDDLFSKHVNGELSANRNG